MFFLIIEFLFDHFWYLSTMFAVFLLFVALLFDWIWDIFFGIGYHLFTGILWIFGISDPDKDTLDWCAKFGLTGYIVLLLTITEFVGKGIGFGTGTNFKSTRERFSRRRQRPQYPPPPTQQRQQYPPPTRRRSI